MVMMQAAPYNPQTNPATSMAGPYSGGAQVQPLSQPNNPYGTLGGLFDTTTMQPSIAAGNYQYTNLQDQLAGIGGMYDVNSQNLQQNAQYQMAGNAITGQEYGIQRGSLARQQALAPQQNALTQGGFDQQLQQALASSQQARRGVDSSATARGAFTAVGTNQQRSDIEQSLAFNQQSIGRNRQSYNLNYQEQLAQQKDSAAQLNLMQDKLGLSGQEIQSRLQNALDQLGISSYMSVQQLLQQYNSMAQGQYSPFSSLIGDIYSLSGIQPALAAPEITSGQKPQ